MYRLACACIARRAWTPNLFTTGCKLAIAYLFCPPDNRHYDYDNLIARMKAGQDGIADGLQFNDKIIRRAVIEFGDVCDDGAVHVTLTTI